MPKIKTHSGAKKRFKLTKTGKVLHAKTNRRHKLNGAKKSANRKRSLRQIAVTDKTNVAQVKRLIPYK